MSDAKDSSSSWTGDVASGLYKMVSGTARGTAYAVGSAATGATTGFLTGGVVGTIAGGLQGSVVGAVGGTTIAAKGALSGLTQVAQGLTADPGDEGQEEEQSCTDHLRWWNEAEARWVCTDLSQEELPYDDEDLLGPIWKELDNAICETEDQNESTPGYFQLLQMDSTENSRAIRRRYYLLTRKYKGTPGILVDGNEEDQVYDDQKFLDVTKAYLVLSDADLRRQYEDTHGENFSGPQWTSVVRAGALLYGFLFGMAEKEFQNCVGRLAVCTSASLGVDSTSSNDLADTRRHIQKRRCTRLAIKLAEKLEIWVQGEQDICKDMWTAEIEFWSRSQYGKELLQTIGTNYIQVAVQFLGSAETGMRPASSFRRWEMEDSLHALPSTMGLKYRFLQTIQNIKDDVAVTIHESALMLLNDQSVRLNARKKRAQGLKVLGEMMAPLLYVSQKDAGKELD